MKTRYLLSALAALTLAASADAADKTYQVTGPVLEMSDKMIAVQKGKERWEIARGADTKTSGEPKVGDKVTIHYTMTATSVEMKPAKATDKAAGAPKE